MPYNGSGTFTLAQAAFVPSTPISSSAMNSDLSDIATNGLSNAVTKDGQTTITGAFKGANGSVGLPMYSFASDTNSGMYRIGADNVGISVGGANILDIASTGLSVTGALAVTGAISSAGFSPSGAILAGDGTVLLPEYSFTSDPDSGIYRIGANNIGVAVNAAKVLDISTSGLNVVGTVSSNGAAFSPTAQAAGMVNGTIVESHSASAVTFAVKTLAGGDPSATDIVYFVFRNATVATGNYVVLQVTAALSITVSSGSTLGTSNTVPFKIWLVAFNDASTVRLGVINTVTGGATPTSIYPLGQVPIASSTAEGGAGGADSPAVFYTGSAVASKAYEILAYASYETGQTTAGTWAASPTRIQLYGIGVGLPGSQVQRAWNRTGSESSGSTAIPNDNTIPQITEGDQYMTQAITPTSTANLLRIEARAHFANSASTAIAAALFQDATADALQVGWGSTANSTSVLQYDIDYTMLAATTSATTFRLRGGANTGATTTFNGASASAFYGGTLNSFVSVTEIMT